jgi:hypothetical protein
MKPKEATREPHTPKMPQDFERFAKALMGVPKKDLDKELAKHEQAGKSKTKPKP